MANALIAILSLVTCLMLDAGSNACAADAATSENVSQAAGKSIEDSALGQVSNTAPLKRYATGLLVGEQGDIIAPESILTSDGQSLTFSHIKISGWFREWGRVHTWSLYDPHKSGPVTTSVHRYT